MAYLTIVGSDVAFDKGYHDYHLWLKKQTKITELQVCLISHV